MYIRTGISPAWYDSLEYDRLKPASSQIAHTSMKYVSSLQIKQEKIFPCQTPAG